MKSNELEQLLEREKTAKLICSELHNYIDLKPTLITVINYVKRLSDCEAVSIRLHDNGDYPYYVYNGFPESFIMKENSLCAKDENGNRIPSPDGKGYLLECMCGNIIRGRFDPSLPFFTKKGSFWSNNTSALLSSTSEEDLQSRKRNYCNSCGYESVALIPIRARNEIIGLIQLNDMRVNMFTEDLIEYMEMIGEQIGLAVQNSLSYSKLKDAFNNIKELERIREEFTTIFTHNLKTPLTTIMGYGNLLVDPNFGEISSEKSEFAEYIQRAASFMFNIVNNIVEASKIESKQIQFTFDNILLDALFKELQIIFKPLAIKKKINLDFSYPKDATVYADNNKIRQVFNNLIDNAFRYTSEGDTIRILATPKKEQVDIIIADTGKGISKSDKEELFKKFTKKQDKVQQTGLGLYIVKEFVRGHGYNIRVESEEGKGTQFFFSLKNGSAIKEEIKL